MSTIVSVLYLFHLIGLTFGMGAATAKTVLLLESRRDRIFVPAFLRASRLMTRLIVVGLVLLILSGAAWFFAAGLRVTPRFVLKLVLVAAIFGIGPLIDNAVTPEYERLAPAGGEPVSPDFLRIERRYVALEITATLLFYAITIMWVLR